MPGGSKDSTDGHPGIHETLWPPADSWHEQTQWLSKIKSYLTSHSSLL